MAVGAAAVWAVWQNQTFGERVARAQQAQAAVSELRVQVERAETARRGYLIDRQPLFIGNYRRAEREAPLALERVRRLTAHSPRQQNRVATLANLLQQQSALANISLAQASAGRIAEALASFSAEDARVIEAIRAETLAMSGEEDRLLAGYTDEQRRSALLIYGVLGLAALLMMLVGLGSFFVILRYTHDLSASRDRLRALNLGLEDAVQARTADLTRANEEIQRFAYIVSHDLRSPLVNVMGFTSELTAALPPLHALVRRAEAEAPAIVTPAAKAAVDADLPEAIGFIRASTQKMDRLINAILRLSREGRRVLTPEPLDVAQIVAGARDSLQHRLVETDGEVIVEGELPAVVTDRLALEQIFSNLIENAVKYAAKDRPPRVVVSGREEAGRVIYEIADNGRGIADNDRERVFELFRRAGVQDVAGEGIGLAHVRALAYRLGGQVTCESVLDQGSTFRLSLPPHITSEQTVRS